LSPQLSRAGEWFLRSGIQDASGGVARYYQSELRHNAPISTEITGYAAGFFAWLHSIDLNEHYLDSAGRAAHFLTAVAWDAAAGVMPYEISPAEFTYFFDCGIIVRGLLAVWRITREQELLDAALAIGNSMLRDFAGPDGDFHPILALPARTPIERDPLRWSRTSTCYQLKSAMAWHDLAEAAGDRRIAAPYHRVLEYSLATWQDFLPGHPERSKVMDRLHAFCYFLEGLLPCAADPRAAATLAAGIEIAARLLRDIAPEVARTDVFAQILRARLFADHAGVLPLDRTAAAWEAAQLATFQVTDDDPRIDGGYWFGRTPAGRLPFVNPVSTAFAAQALELWNGAHFDRHHLI
jgi:hypothetical protein